ncbi:MAG: hypothetical protein MUP27_09030 [Desulfobacterales bacterium]|nr:hypothetical protein [Desulfobacterales bacterium]
MRKNWVVSSGNVSVEFDELLENRDLSILIRIDDKKYWLPKSQIDFQEWSKIVEVPVWLAEKKGLV